MLASPHIPTRFVLVSVFVCHLRSAFGATWVAVNVLNDDVDASEHSRDANHSYNRSHVLPWLSCGVLGSSIDMPDGVVMCRLGLHANSMSRMSMTTMQRSRYSMFGRYILRHDFKGYVILVREQLVH